MGELVRQGDKLDKYRAHILEGRKLAPEEEKQLARYRKAVSLLSTGYSRLRVIATMKADPLDPLSESQLYNIVRDAVKLYGNLEEVDKKAERWIAYENYKLLADLARRQGDYGAAIRAQKAADDLLGLFAPDQGMLDPQAFLVPVAMMFSTDKKVLEKQEKSETIDVDYEEAK